MTKYSNLSPCCGVDPSEIVECSMSCVVVHTIILPTLWKRIRLNGDEVEGLLCAKKSHLLSDDNWWLVFGPCNLELAGGDPTTALVAIHFLLDNLRRENAIQLAILVHFTHETLFLNCYF